MKNTVMRRYVDVHKLGPALIALKNSGHPSYQFVVENVPYLNRFLSESQECEEMLDVDEQLPNVKKMVESNNR